MYRQCVQLTSFMFYAHVLILDLLENSNQNVSAPKIIFNFPSSQHEEVKNHFFVSFVICSLCFAERDLSNWSVRVFFVWRLPIVNCAADHLLVASEEQHLFSVFTCTVHLFCVKLERTGDSKPQRHTTFCIVFSFFFSLGQYLPHWWLLHCGVTKQVVLTVLLTNFHTKHKCSCLEINSKLITRRWSEIITA